LGTVGHGCAECNTLQLNTTSLVIRSRENRKKRNQGSKQASKTHMSSLKQWQASKQQQQQHQQLKQNSSRFNPEPLTTNFLSTLLHLGMDTSYYFIPQLSHPSALPFPLSL